MSYMALYRKWRPRDFDEVRGQDAIVRTLRNQIIYQRIGHAYLFSGTRGTGKTSLAKLFAKAVNCQHPVNGNPCNECPTCQAINDSASMDVIEIDAASNNGVDNVREIRDQVQYSPVSGRYKVYIIDEVHMLSPGAFNALLKTLEEPPSYVIFILATTEKHKIPITILSRCQKYDFRRISIDIITDHLTDLMKKEKIKADPEALGYIARAADGSMRDALSLLDQCISFYLGEKLTYDNVLSVLGTVDAALFSKLLSHILSQETGEVLKIIDDTIYDGRELTQFLSDFLWYLRNLLILKDPRAGEDNLEMASQTIAKLREDSWRCDTNSLLRFIRILSELSNELRFSTQKRILLEVGFIKLCQPQMETNTDSLLERLRLLEDKIENGVFLSQDQAAGTPHPTNPGTGQSNSAPRPRVLSGEQAEKELRHRFSPAQVEDLRKIASKWQEIIGEFSPPMRLQLRKARLAVSESSELMQLIFKEEDKLSKSYFEQNNHENLDILSEMVARQTGKEVTFQCISESTVVRSSANPINLNSIHLVKVEVDEDE
ncbi:MAG: DNA polymerase III subunit gamma/tau [Eubacterium sp.]|nr:DNA polymerase III subunit gamma/tau [Eubacterium sp.]